MDAFTPFPVEGLHEAISPRQTRLPMVVLAAAMTGALLGFGTQWFASVIHYPLNIGGRPLNSWPAFIPITFELAVLFAAFAAVVGMIAANRLPMPYHPVFAAKNFERASSDRFFLCLEAEDVRFDREHSARFLRDAGSRNVTEVKW
jgi:hypothetical protein